jgi:hypothetical protein
MTWKPTPHPLLPPPTPAEIRAILQNPGGEARLMEIYQKREERIRLSIDQPGRYSVWLPIWKLALEWLDKKNFAYWSGGNRASKSTLAAMLFVIVAMAYPRSKMWAFQGSEDTSIHQQQNLVWQMLPPHVRALNKRKSATFYVQYTEANGFSNNTLILPNGTLIKFLTYQQETKGYEGWELGADLQRLANEKKIDLENLPKITGTNMTVPNLGVWADEGMTLDWFELIQPRCATRYSKILWTYTPVDGITPTVKQFRGTAPKIVLTHHSELLPDRVNVPGCPSGHMPLVEEPSGVANAVIVYFFTQFNPWAGYESKLIDGQHYPGLKEKSERRSEEYRERRIYGYARDIMKRAFAMFGPVHIVKRAHIPKIGTWYQSCDPAPPRRNFYWFYAIVAEDGKIYIAMEWPDQRTYGPWAVPSTKKPPNADGDQGPAQMGRGYGVVRYKKFMVAQERKLAGEKADDRAIEIDTRLLDPRAARNEHLAEHGASCIQDDFYEEQWDDEGNIVGPSMDFQPAKGIHIADGEQQIAGLLEWDETEPLDAVRNAPALYVCEECQQMIDALSNYTGEGGEKGGYKDPVDGLRYLVTSEPEYVAPDAYEVRPGGTY